ncbi:DedA family protein [Agrococcus jejuensis]|uniref:Membrane-associated protein n=1 Tax=Agrococcus jejuensis TaxID=399736 RepID=A0A1G8GBT7_9MICO|nr:DedA family protein [Agrococcus jejuensis]SDH91796.1 membrane-associated protein [Agrococcus jejuensis]
MHHLPANALFDVEGLITGAGGWALVLVCAIVFVETGLLVGFLLPGDTLLIITGVLSYSGVIHQPVWLCMLAIWLCAVAGDQLGYYIGYKAGPPIFQRKSSGLFSHKTIARTNGFFTKYGPWAVIVARFIGIVRTFMPVAAGVGRMPYRRFLRYDIVGGLLWGAGLTFLGWAVAHIPGVADIVTQYIDLVLIGVVAIALCFIVVHAIQSRREVQEERRSGTDSGHVATLDLSDDVRVDPVLRERDEPGDQRA